jgi:hypothetical protein
VASKTPDNQTLARQVLIVLTGALEICARSRAGGSIPAVASIQHYESISIFCS